MSTQIDREPFGTTQDGHAVERITLRNARGNVVRFLTYGATLQSWEVGGTELTLGFDELLPYETVSPYFGSTVGRVGNRIARGKFSLEGKDYTLAINNGPNHLHGGPGGYAKRIWEADVEGDAVRFRLVDPDGTEGYPGTVTAEVRVTYSDDDVLRLDYSATTDQTTPINLTNHAYFNLRDGGASPILDHVAHLRASHFIPVDDTLIPTGEIAPVTGTPIDFTSPKPIGQDVLGMGGEPAGYDHCVVVDGEPGTLRLAAEVTDPVSGRRLETWTTETGMQLYSGNFLDGSITGRRGAVFHQYHGFCLETQHFPDSINQPNFPSTLLHPGDVYRTSTEYRMKL